ncbi:S46 family peptidase [soil metagenome]
MAAFAVIGAATAVLSATAGPARADEGMWTFDNFPIQMVNDTYGSHIDQAWLDRVRGAAVRINGCSASLVSGQGLILTNWHCVEGCAQNLSSAGTDHIRNGFLTATREDEKECPGETAEILTDITDVTDRVLAAGAGLDGAAFVAARAAVTAQIQDESCTDKQTQTCQVISFYRGGRYALYTFRKYEDVRLVFSPENQAAFFGGDPDNFNFPRYALDCGFLRIYQNGQPLATPNHLPWNPNPPKEGDLVFVAGNPGTTSRLLTISQLERLRDQELPITLIQASELRGRLQEYATTSPEAKRVTFDPLFGLENSFKVYYGQEGALTDPTFMDKKRKEEADLRAAVAADPAIAARIGDPWTDLERVQTAARDLYLPYRQLESDAGRRSTLYGYARTIVRAAKERAKPMAERRAGNTEADLAAAQRKLADVVPIDAGLEEINLTQWLLKTREYLTVDNAQVKALLGRDAPADIADRLVTGTHLGDPAFRAQAFAMTPEQLATLDDPMIQFVLAHDDDAQAIRAQWDSAVTAPTNKAAEKIAQARFAVYGTHLYPDATFSLRLSYGQVKGWTYRGVTVPAFTYVGGLYERATGAEPFNAAQAFIDAESKVNKDVVYDFVSTNDIIGGNSGSPVINAAGEVIGAAFDGNIHSLGGSYGYDGELNRTVTVSTAAITEALRHVYPQPRLLAELGVR